MNDRQKQPLMMNRSFLFLLLAASLLGLPAVLSAQSADDSRVYELGLGGMMLNLSRMTVTDFRQTAGGDYVFRVEDKHLYGGFELYAATPLKPWLYVDVQGSLGMARYMEGGRYESGCSLLLGPGLQWRPWGNRSWVQPYLRLGIDYFTKDFPLRYFGVFEGDVTGEGVWRAEDAWNKGYTFDAKRLIPVSAGIGLVGWVTDRLGVRLQGRYLRALGNSGANFAQFSAGVVACLGKSGRTKAVADRYVAAHPEIYDAFYAARLPERVVEKEVVREVPVERVVERIVEKESGEKSERILAEMMENVNFDFDTAVLSPSSGRILDAVAQMLLQYPDTRFLVCGYTDSVGSDEYNAALSRDRAKAVWQALVNRGVPAARLAWRGFGNRVALMPPSASEEQRRVDRKVVLERIQDEATWDYLTK